MPSESDEAPLELALFALSFLPAVAKNLPMNRVYRFGRYYANRIRRSPDAVNHVVTDPNSRRAVREMVSAAYALAETDFSRKYL